MEKNSLDIIKEMTCKIKEATKCLVKEQETEEIATPSSNDDKEDISDIDENDIEDDIEDEELNETTNSDLLILAAKQGDLNTVKFLVNHGADIHLNDNEAFKVAKTQEIKDYLKANGVNEDEDEELNESKKKWIPKMKKGALHKKLGIPEDEKIPLSLINKEIARLQKLAEGDTKLSKEDAKLLKELVLAKTLKKM